MSDDSDVIITPSKRRKLRKRRINNSNDDDDFESSDTNINNNKKENNNDNNNISPQKSLLEEMVIDSEDDASYNNNNNNNNDSDYAPSSEDDNDHIQRDVRGIKEDAAYERFELEFNQRRRNKFRKKGKRQRKSKYTNVEIPSEDDDDEFSDGLEDFVVDDTTGVVEAEESIDSSDSDDDKETNNYGDSLAVYRTTFNDVNDEAETLQLFQNIHWSTQTEESAFSKWIWYLTWFLLDPSIEEEVYGTLIRRTEEDCCVPKLTGPMKKLVRQSINAIENDQFAKIRDNWVRSGNWGKNFKNDHANIHREFVKYIDCRPILKFTSYASAHALSGQSCASCIKKMGKCQIELSGPIVKVSDLERPMKLEMSLDPNAYDEEPHHFAIGEYCLKRAHLYHYMRHYKWKIIEKLNEFLKRIKAHRKDITSEHYGIIVDHISDLKNCQWSANAYTLYKNLMNEAEKFRDAWNRKVKKSKALQDEDIPLGHYHEQEYDITVEDADILNLNKALKKVIREARAKEKLKKKKVSKHKDSHIKNNSKRYDSNIINNDVDIDQQPIITNHDYSKPCNRFLENNNKMTQLIDLTDDDDEEEMDFVTAAKMRSRPQLSLIPTQSSINFKDIAAQRFATKKKTVDKSLVNDNNSLGSDSSSEDSVIITKSRNKRRRIVLNDDDDDDDE